MAESQPRTILDPAKIFQHAPAFSTRSRTLNPAGLVLDDVQSNDEGGTEEFLITLFINKSNLPQDGSPEHLPSTTRAVSSPEDSYRSESNISDSQIGNEFSNNGPGSVHSERDDAESFINPREQSSESAIIYYAVSSHMCTRAND